MSGARRRSTIRLELRAQGTLVVGVHAGYIDTDMAASINEPKVRPEDVAVRTIEAIIAGDEEVLADQPSREIRAALDADRHSLNRQMQQVWDSRKHSNPTNHPLLMTLS